MGRSPAVDPVRGQAARAAGAAWDSLVSSAVRRDRNGRVLLLDRPGGRPATLWPYSQVLHASVVVGDLRGDREPARVLGRGLERYRSGDAYMSRRRPRRGPLFYDDNAWVGLAAAHARLLGEGVQVERLCGRLLAWTRTGEDPAGGVRWRVGRGSRHACSTGAAGVLALRCGQENPGAAAYDATAFARRCAAFLCGPLLLGSGLVADNIDRGVVDPTPWSYNQGLTIGLLVLLHRDGDPDGLRMARELAGSAVAYYSAQDRLWRQPPCFVAILGRMLLLLQSCDGDPRWSAFVDGYLDRVWSSAVDGSGALTGGGIGAYDREWTLDQAGLVILSALRAAPAERWNLVC